MIIGNDINDMFYLLCQEACEWPVETRRGGDRLLDSPIPIVAAIAHPQKRVLNVRFRNNSLPAACAETLWVLIGRNDVEWLSFYLPRAKDFSDDGKTWRAAYGPRLRGKEKYHRDGWEHNRIDQLDCVIKELKKDSSSRRAVVGIFEPQFDYLCLLEGHETSSGWSESTKDFPCTQSLSFMVRNGALDLTVFIRSNDLIWGWSGVNVFEFTVLQELVAAVLKMPVGRYFHISNNLHVYERYWNMVRRIRSEVSMAEVRYPYRDWKDPKYARFDSLEQIDQQLRDFFDVEKLIRKENVSVDFIKNVRAYKGTLIDDLVSVVLAYCAYKRGNIEVSIYAREMICDSALAAAYDRYIAWEVTRDAKRSVNHSAEEARKD